MDTLKPLSRFGISLLAVLLLSCASIQTGSHFDENVSLKDFKTFSWISDDPMMPQDKNSIIVSSLSKKYIENSIKQNLTLKGYAFQPSAENADFVISYSVGTREKVVIDDYSNVDKNKSSWYWQGEDHNADRWHINTWTEGTLMIEIFDGKSKEPVWHGWATKAVTRADIDNPSETIEKAVSGIFKEFPISTNL